MLAHNSSERSPAYEHRRPILVTGAHRTGTTWVGKMLAASEEVAYISEPLNVYHRPGVLRVPINHWYTYICPQNQTDYLPAIRETLSFHYHTRAEIKSLRSRKDLLRMGRDWSNFLIGRIYKRRALLKDPFAILSAPWFAEVLGCQVVITMRHPAAFASSLKRLNWPFDFNNLLAQPLLMQDWLHPFKNEMEMILQSPKDVIVQSSLLWRIVYYVVTQYREQFPQFRVVRHEDLSLDPLQSFRNLYDNLGLAFTPGVQRTILNSSRSTNPKELSTHSIHAVRLDSHANLYNWKSRLEAEEIERIHCLTKDVADIYYPEQSWE